jgi:hypothetical protein
MPPFKLVQSKTLGGGVRSGGLAVNTNVIAPARTGAAPTTPTSPTTHIPNAAPPPQPIDYVAACGKITLCVYIPAVASYDNGFTISTHHWVALVDPLLPADLCAQDGGAFSNGSCALTYLTDEKVSVFPGNPPSLQASVNCSSAAFSTVVDPLGVAEITSNFDALLQATKGSQDVMCAVDLEKSS